MIFDSESVFEDNVITVLKQHGWKDGVLRYPTEQDLLDNWKGILYRNNNDIDRLGKYPLTDGEMAQIIEQIETLRTPLALNSFVNGRTVSITRDNKEDVAHFGKEISLYIYDRKEIAGGKSTYQIAQQPVYPAKNKMLNSRRGDLVLLINGMPLIHIELKKSGIPVSQATNQIEKYTHEGVFTGLFRLVQIFVAMNPDDAVYFANPGVDKFNPSYYFHWADYNNEPICGGQNPGKDEWKLFIGGTSGTAGCCPFPWRISSSASTPSPTRQTDASRCCAATSTSLRTPSLTWCANAIGNSGQLLRDDQAAMYGTLPVPEKP